jgi:regulatory factor X
VRFLDIFQVTQALSTVLTNQKQLADMRRSWQSIDFESVRNQSALVCNCRHEDLVQLLEVDFVTLLNGLAKSAEPVGEVMAWADNCCERLMGGNRGAQVPGVTEERSTLSSRSMLIRWGYVTSQIMRDLVSSAGFRFARVCVENSWTNSSRLSEATQHSVHSRF